MCVITKWSSTWSVFTLLFLVFENNLYISAHRTYFNNETEVESSYRYHNLLTSVFQNNDGVVNVQDYNKIQNKIVGMISKSYSEHVEYICDIDDNTVEHRKKKNLLSGITNGGRQQLTEMLKLTKGIYKKHMSALLLAYKFKFFTLFPLLTAALLLIVKTAGAAGFFFAMFLASIAMKSHH